MKRSEIAMIILIASLSMLFTFTLAQSLLGDKVKRKASVEQATTISKELVQPAKRTFNKDAVNPTVEVCVEKMQTDADGSTPDSPDCTGSDTTTTQAEESDSSQDQPTTTSSGQATKTTN
ncbi:hypothetical protein GII36_00935 [Candidatus Mycosynbacter amalyticus]|uniref:Uncharacterized protein n=1 Tax=Candidatus Mycosynbacter amalyticus TaxID=2665156 RepID=A0A857MKX0_9BACT|nr:hypothetical protein [Candidatus Mycosynbacter amalyticus]QHN42425.1 hypothetical protein GII36_00935 [Candidatus Mycosynbacter amalyticus]